MRDLKNVLKKIPDVDFHVKLHKFDPEEMKPDLDAVGLSLKGEDEVFISINAKRLNSEFPLRVEMKNLSKVKDCSWLVVVGDEKNNKVFAIKKTYFKKTLKREFQVSIPPETEQIDVYLMSDSYIGIDQVYSINLENYKTPGKKEFKFRKRNKKGGEQAENEEKKKNNRNRNKNKNNNKNRKRRGKGKKDES